MRGAATLELLRHAEADHNLGGHGAVLGGWADLPLTSRGDRQAEQLAARLALEPPPAALYSSSSTRALATAAPIADRYSLQPVLEQDLREIHCGAVDGMAIEEVRARHPQLWAAHLRQEDPDFRWPGGESYREFRERVLAVLARIAAAHPSGRVLIVTHAGVISQVMGFCRGSCPARWEDFRPRNASLTTLRWQAGRWAALRFDGES